MDLPPHVDDEKGGSMMETRRLGNSDLHIPPVGLGTWAIDGPGYEFGWGLQDDRASIEASLPTGQRQRTPAAA